MSGSPVVPGTPSETSVRDLARTGSQALAVRSAALVRRGLRDLARDSNWLIRKVFTGPVSHAAVSTDGQVCTFSPQIRHGSQSLTLFDIERCVPTLTLSLSTGADAPGVDSPARFAWSPDARYLLGSWPAQSPAQGAALQLFDLHAKMLVGAFGKYSRVPSDIAWSPSGSLAVSSCGGENPSLDLWRMHHQSAGQGASLPASASPLQQLRVPDWIEQQAVQADSGEAGTFSGYGKVAFSPDEKSLAAVVEIGGEWADDLIVFLGATTLGKKFVFEAQGRVTDLAWSNDGNRIVYCSAGQAYGIDPVSAESASLPFGGEQCAWHPHLAICLFFSSWLRSSAKGRLFLADMNRIHVFDEYPAEGVLGLRWSQDGSKAYAITSEGLAYIYEPELL
jgi:WD40 repeat protein